MAEALQYAEEQGKSGNKATASLSLNAYQEKVEFKALLPPSVLAKGTRNTTDKVNRKKMTVKKGTKDVTGTKETKKMSEMTGESGLTEIRLPDDDRLSWAAFLHWSGSPSNQILKDVLEDHRLVRSWVFAKKYGFLDFADEIMHTLIIAFGKFEGCDYTKASIKPNAIREAYCIDNVGPSQMKVLVCEEIVKSNLYSKCKSSDKFHDPDKCKDCEEDREDIFKLKCRRDANNPHKSGYCPLDFHLFTHVLAKKFDFPEDSEKFDDRLTKRRAGSLGGPPMYMEFLCSKNSKELKGLFENSDRESAPARLAKPGQSLH